MQQNTDCERTYVILQSRYPASDRNVAKTIQTASVNELTPPGYTFIGECRTGMLFKSEYKFAKMPSPRFKTFEVLDVKTTQNQNQNQKYLFGHMPDPGDLC